MNPTGRYLSRPRILSSQILNNPFHRSKNRNPCNLILVSSSAMRGSERWPTLGRGCCWNPFTDVEDGLRGLEGPRPCSRRLKVGTRGRLQRKYQMLSAGSRSIRVPLVHSRKLPRLGPTWIMRAFVPFAPVRPPRETPLVLPSCVLSKL